MFWSVIFSYSMQQWTISQKDCDLRWKVDCIRQPAMTSSGFKLRRSSKALPKAKPVSRKDGGHCLVVCYWADPLELSESRWNQYILEHPCLANGWDLQPKTVCTEQICTEQICMESCNVCSQQWSTERAHFFLHDNGRPHIAQPKLQKLHELGYEILPHLPYSPLTNQLPLFQSSWQLFLQGKCFHNQQDAENAFQGFLEPWSMDVYATGINKFVFLWQDFVDCNHSYFD